MKPQMVFHHNYTRAEVAQDRIQQNQFAGPNEFFQNLLLSVSSVKYRFKHWFSFFALVKFNRYLTDPYRYIIDCYCFHNLFLIDFYQ